MYPFYQSPSICPQTVFLNFCPKLKERDASLAQKLAHNNSTLMIYCFPLDSLFCGLDHFPCCMRIEKGLLPARPTENVCRGEATAAHLLLLQRLGKQERSLILHCRRKYRSSPFFDPFPSGRFPYGAIAGATATAKDLRGSIMASRRLHNLILSIQKGKWLSALVTIPLSSFPLFSAPKRINYGLIAF